MATFLEFVLIILCIIMAAGIIALCGVIAIWIIDCIDSLRCKYLKYKYNKNYGKVRRNL